MADQEIRDLGFLAWKDPDAWMENMSGPKWEAVVAEENKRFKKVVEKPEIQKLIPKIKQELKDSSKYWSHIQYRDGNIQIVSEGTSGLKFRSFSASAWKEARDVLACPGGLLYIHDIGDGAEQFQLVVLLKSQAWKRNNVGPTVGFINNKAVYLLASGLEGHALWYNCVCMCNLDNRENEKILYTEKDPRYNLTLIRCEEGSLFFQRENCGQTDTWHIGPHGGLKQIARGSYRQIPYNENLYLFLPTLNGKYIASDGSWLPPDETPLWISDKYNMLLTQKMGTKTLWENNISKNVLSAGTIEPDPWAYWNGSKSRFLIDNGYEPPYFLGESSPPQHKFPIQLKPQRITTQSQDGQTVSGIAIVPTNKVNGLLVVGYGAYGAPSPPSGFYKKWGSLLRRGWVIMTTYLRGGGDDTPVWAQAGRLDGRDKTIEDFLALVQAGQKEFNVPASRTVIYGRSAGGLLMGNSLARAPKLFSAVYTEVPYVDVLRTTTNPDLPLTAMEYEEFGNPRASPWEASFVARLSPANLDYKCSDTFVLARTSLNDSQVLTYEPVKWIRRVRESSPEVRQHAPKIIYISAGQGHFLAGDEALQARAEDLASLLDWTCSPKKNVGHKYNKMASRRSRSTRRSTRRNNNVNMMGGKKRRASKRRATRRR